MSALEDFKEKISNPNSYTLNRNENLKRISEFLSFSPVDGYWENSFNI